MPIGRNDPCPCGSGKKYKRCHGAFAAEARAANPDIARAKEFKALDFDLGQRLLRFAKLRFAANWLIGVLAEYTGSEEGGDFPEQELPLAIPWALHSWRPPVGGETVAEAWAEDRGSRLTDRERTLVDAYSNSWLSLWEVTRVERGVGLALVDRLTREERFAHDVTASSTTELHDMLLATVLDCDGVSFFGGVHPQPLPPRYAELALRAARKICRVRTRAVAYDLLRDNVIQLEIIDVWNDVVDDMLGTPPPTLTNTDGDLFALTTDDFEMIGPRAEVVSRIASMPGATPPQNEGGEAVIVFTTPGNAAHPELGGTVIGRVVVGKQRVRAETNSLRRADALRAKLEVRAGDLLRHRLRQETNTADLMERALAAPTGPQRGVNSSPEAAAMIRELREKYMRAWLDESIPALGGLTPREAARTPRARSALELLLKDIERSESRLAPEEQIDLSWLRPALGRAEV